VHGLRQTYHRLEIVLDEAYGTPSDVAHVESYFGPFREGVSVRAR
jgi:hypothetical protein